MSVHKCDDDDDHTSKQFNIILECQLMKKNGVEHCHRHHGRNSHSYSNVRQEHNHIILDEG